MATISNTAITNRQCTRIASVDSKLFAGKYQELFCLLLSSSISIKQVVLSFNNELKYFSPSTFLVEAIALPF